MVDARLLDLLHPKLFDSTMRAVVIERIRGLRISVVDKRSLYAAWLLRVDVPLRMHDLNDVGEVAHDDADRMAHAGVRDRAPQAVRQ